MSRPARQRRSERTRWALLDAARELFAERGFAGTSLEDIAERASVTRGPLYHYFDDKEDLFRAVYEEVERYLAENVLIGIRSRVTSGSGAWDQVKACNDAFLDAVLDPAIQRIALIEAASVLGWNARKDFARYGRGLIREGLQRAIDEGVLDRQPVEPLTHLFHALLTEGAIFIAQAEDKAAARAEIGAAIDRLINGLRRPGSSSVKSRKTSS